MIETTAPATCNRKPSFKAEKRYCSESSSDGSQESFGD